MRNRSLIKKKRLPGSSNQSIGSGEFLYTHFCPVFHSKADTVLTELDAGLWGPARQWRVAHEVQWTSALRRPEQSEVLGPTVAACRWQALATTESEDETRQARSS